MNLSLPFRFYQVRDELNLDEICRKFKVKLEHIERDSGKTINDPLQKDEMLCIKNF
ncbi:MAG: hypothetical protein ABH823_02525 [bacterium]